MLHNFIYAPPSIKYSKMKHSPISLTSIGSIRLGAHNSYGDHSGLIGDDSEGKYKQIDDWTKQQSKKTEARKKRISEKSSILGYEDLRNSRLKISVTRVLNGIFWLYCTSIDPRVHSKRIEQMIRTNSEYDYMTKIDEPAAFAKQLGHDIGNWIVSNKDLKYDCLILVSHGPVIYLEEEKKSELLDYASECIDEIIPIELFVKDRKYEVQQEYRFVVNISLHSPTEKEICLKVSEDLKKFMSPLSYYMSDACPMRLGKGTCGTWKISCRWYRGRCFFNQSLLEDFYYA